LIEYYERRAAEYDATAWDYPGGDHGGLVRSVLTSLKPARTLDIGCGTGYVSRWLPGEVTLLDASPSMLAIAQRRLPQARTVRAEVPPLPFADHTFGRAFAANFYGHLPSDARSHLVSEMARVAEEILVLDQLSQEDLFNEGIEERELLDGTKMPIHKCYFTVQALLDEIEGGEVLLNGPVFAIIRRSLLRSA
jgi:ubiquinone/menaquinone biosynthesis C-methylase UbiE